MSKETTSIIFTGDIGFDKYMYGKWEDENLLSKPLTEFLHSGDHLCINVEGAVIDAKDDGKRGIFFHSMNPKAVSVFEKMGADIWSIGNNHTMDAGEAGVVSTAEYARKSNALYFGAGLNDREASAPIYLDEAGGIGIFGVSYMAECIPATKTSAGVFRWDDMEYIKARINEIKSRCRWCVVVAHGGEEFSPMPNPYTRQRYLEYLEMGADVVVGHHPHVPENYEATEDGKYIFYSLGNFIFDTDYQRVHRYTDTGIVLKLEFSKDNLGFKAVGIKIDRTTENISLCPLPDIFTDIDGEEYQKLIPLSAKAFIISEMKKMEYLEPERFAGAEKSVWNNYFFSTEPDGYFKDAHMDFSLIVPLAEEESKKAWQSSRLEKVKNYILDQIKGES